MYSDKSCLEEFILIENLKELQEKCIWVESILFLNNLIN